MVTVRFEDDSDFSRKVNFDSMQNLRGLEETVQSLPSILGATISLIDSLMRLNTDLCSESLYGLQEFEISERALRATLTRVRGYKDSAEGLLCRIKGILRLVCFA